MQANPILESHWARANARWSTRNDRTAAHTAALHVALDMDARRHARDLPAAPINPEWLGTAPRAFDGARRRRVTTQMVAILARHSQRVHDARNHVKDCSASMQAVTIALVSVLR